MFDEKAKKVAIVTIVMVAIIAFITFDTWRVYIPNQGYDPNEGVVNNAGECVQPGRAGNLVISTCCKDLQGRLVSCKTGDLLAAPIKAAVVGGIPAIGQIQWGIDMDNLGNINIDSATVIVNAVNKATGVAEPNLNSCFTNLVAKSIPIKSKAHWDSSWCNLGWVTSVTPITYTLTFSGSALNTQSGLTSSQQYQMDVIIAKEDIGFRLTATCAQC